MKGVTGYDVTALLVGSEGTLAVFTEATLRLVPKPPALATALALFTDVRAAADTVSSELGQVLNSRPRMIDITPPPPGAPV